MFFSPPTLFFQILYPPPYLPNFMFYLSLKNTKIKIKTNEKSTRQKSAKTEQKAHRTPPSYGAIHLG